MAILNFEQRHDLGEASISTTKVLYNNTKCDIVLRNRVFHHKV